MFFFFLYSADLLFYLSDFSPFMGEYLFFELAKEKVPKERPPTVLAFGFSALLSLERRDAELAALRQSSRYSALSFQLLDEPKGVIRSTTKSKSGRCNLMQSGDRHNCTSSYRRRPVSRMINKLKRIDSGKNPAGMTKNGFSLVFSPSSLPLISNLPFRLAEKHRMRRRLRDVFV